MSPIVVLDNKTIRHPRRPSRVWPIDSIAPSTGFLIMPLLYCLLGRLSTKSIKTLRCVGVLDNRGRLQYNSILREHNMSEAQAALYARLAYLQSLTDLDDDCIQDAIQKLAQAIEDHVA